MFRLVMIRMFKQTFLPPQLNSRHPWIAIDHIVEDVVMVKRDHGMVFDR